MDNVDDQDMSEGGEYLYIFDEKQNKGHVKPIKTDMTIRTLTEKCPKGQDEYDIVLKPAHYCDGRTLQPWDVIDDWNLDEDYYLASSLEYIARAGRKLYPDMDARQSAIKDLGKAVQYINRKIEKLKKEI